MSTNRYCRRSTFDDFCVLRESPLGILVERRQGEAMLLKEC